MNDTPSHFYAGVCLVIAVCTVHGGYTFLTDPTSVTRLTNEKGNVTTLGALYGVTVAIGMGLCAYACTTALWHVLPNNGGYADAAFEGTTVWLASLGSALFVPTKMVAIGKRMSELQKTNSMMAD
jgi:hypothetical protein